MGILIALYLFGVVIVLPAWVLWMMSRYQSVCTRCGELNRNEWYGALGYWKCTCKSCGLVVWKHHDQRMTLTSWQMKKVRAYLEKAQETNDAR